MYVDQIKPEKYQTLFTDLNNGEITQHEFRLNLALNLLEDLKNNKYDWTFKPSPPRPEKLRELQEIPKTDKQYQAISTELYKMPEVIEYLDRKVAIMHINHSIYHGYKYLHEVLKEFPEMKKDYMDDMQRFESLFLGRERTYR